MKMVCDAKDLIEHGVWETYCFRYNVNPYAINEGLMTSDEEITITIEEGVEWGLLPEWPYG